jgi:hypothetical protein
MSRKTSDTGVSKHLNLALSLLIQARREKYAALNSSLLDMDFINNAKAHYQEYSQAIAYFEGLLAEAGTGQLAVLQAENKRLQDKLVMAQKVIDEAEKVLEGSTLEYYGDAEFQAALKIWDEGKNK